VREKYQWAGLFVAILIASHLPSAATEPEGFFRLRPSWTVDGAVVSRQPETAERTTWVDLAPVGDVESARLTILVPVDVSVRFAVSWIESVQELPAVEGRRAFVLDLGRIPARSGRRIPLDFTPPPGGGGIVSFIAEGVAGEERAVREAAGWTVGHPGTAPVSRHGAAEFRAVPVPENSR